MNSLTPFGAHCCHIHSLVRYTMFRGSVKNQNLRNDTIHSSKSDQTKSSLAREIKQMFPQWESHSSHGAREARVFQVPLMSKQSNCPLHSLCRRTDGCRDSGHLQRSVGKTGLRKLSGAQGFLHVYIPGRELPSLCCVAWAWSCGDKEMASVQ